MRNKKQIKAAEKSLSEWLGEEFGQTPVDMECMHDYLSLEYYNGRIDGKLRILKALSKYLKEEIPLDLLLNAYDIVMKEENLSKTKRYMNFLEQDLKDIGI